MQGIITGEYLHQPIGSQITLTALSSAPGGLLTASWNHKGNVTFSSPTPHSRGFGTFDGLWILFLTTKQIYVQIFKVKRKTKILNLRITLTNKQY